MPEFSGRAGAYWLVEKPGEPGKYIWRRGKIGQAHAVRFPDRGSAEKAARNTRGATGGGDREVVEAPPMSTVRERSVYFIVRRRRYPGSRYEWIGRDKEGFFWTDVKKLVKRFSTRQEAKKANDTFPLRERGDVYRDR